MSNPSNQTHQFNYTIVSDTKAIDKQWKISPEIKSEFANISDKLGFGHTSIINKLLKLIEKYPHVPHFKNFLSTEYQQRGEHQKALEINHFILAQHPDYLYGKINLANEYLSKKEYDKIPPLFPLFELQAMYPNRTEFHYGEVADFYQTILRYFAVTKQFDMLNNRLPVFEKLNNEFELEQKEFIDEMKLAIFMGKLAEKARFVEAVPKKITEPSSKRPVFTHKEINDLYHYDFSIPHATIKTILALPRKTLIEDLNKVLYDSVARFEYLSSHENDKDAFNDSPLHAFNLLTELHAVESLPLMFDLMRQEKVFYDYYFGDIFSYEIWYSFYAFAKNNSAELYNFLLEQDRCFSVRSVMLKALRAIASLHPERINEVLAYFDNFIDAQIANVADDRFIDTAIIGDVLLSIKAFNAGYLLPKIKQLYDLDLVNVAINGTYNEYCNEFRESEPEEFIVYDSIYQRYDSFVENYSNDEDDDDELWGDNEVKDD